MRANPSVALIASLLLLAGACLFGSAASADPELEAHLVDDTVHAKDSTAVVEVAVTGVDLVDPDEVGSQPRPGQAHLHYQLDGGPFIATTARKLAFHELAPGAHRIKVALAGNDHEPIAPPQTVPVLIPTAVLAH